MIIKILIWLWVFILVFMFLMIPIKLLSTRNIICPKCGQKTMVKKKHSQGVCSYCGATLENPQP